MPRDNRPARPVVVDQAAAMARGELTRGMDRVVVFYHHRITKQAFFRNLYVDDIHDLPAYVRVDRRLTDEERRREVTLYVKNINPYFHPMTARETKLVRIPKVRILARVECGKLNFVNTRESSSF